MASLVTKLWTKLCAKKVPLTVMIVGLDNSGKTSILNDLLAASSGSSSLAAPPRPKDQDQRKNRTISHDIGIDSTKTLDGQFSANNQLLISAAETTTSSSPSRPAQQLKSMPNQGNGRQATPTIGYNYERVQFKSLSLTVLDFSGQNRYRNLWQEFYNGVDAIVFVIDSSDLIRLVVVRDELETLLSHPFFRTLRGNGDCNNNTKSATGGPTRLTNPMLAQRRFHISQGKLIQTPLDTSTAAATASSSHLANNTTTTTDDRRNSKSKLTRSNSKLRSKVPILFLANKSDLPNSVDSEVITNALNLNQLPCDRHPWIIRASSATLNQGIVEGFDWLVGQLSTA